MYVRSSVPGGTTNKDGMWSGIGGSGCREDDWNGNCHTDDREGPTSGRKGGCIWTGDRSKMVNSQSNSHHNC